MFVVAVIYWLIAGAMVIQTIRRFLSMRRLPRWNNDGRVRRHNGTPHDANSWTLFATPHDFCTPVISAESTLRFRHLNWPARLAGMIVPLVLGCALAWLGIWLSSIQSRWIQVAWCIVCVAVVRATTDTQDGFMSIVGTDGIAWFTCRANYRGDRGQIAPPRHLTFADVRQVYAQDHQLLVFKIGGFGLGESVHTIRRPVGLDHDGWLRLKAAIVACHHERLWSLALLRLATIESMSIEGIDVRSSIGVGFDVLGGDGVNQPLKGLVMTMPDDRVKRLYHMRIAFTLTGLAVEPGTLQGPDHGARAQVSHMHSAPLHLGGGADRQSLSKCISWPSGGDGTCGPANNTPLVLQFASDRSLSLQPERFPDLPVLRRLVESRIWSDGIATVVREEVQCDREILSATVVSNDKSPLGTVLPRHRRAVWEAARALSRVGLIEEITDEEIERTLGTRLFVRNEGELEWDDKMATVEAQCGVLTSQIWTKAAGDYQHVLGSGPQDFPRV